MAKKARKSSNWSELRDRSYLDTAQGRDVHGEQQLARGKLQEKQSLKSRQILSAVLGVLAFILVWVVWGGISGAMEGFNRMRGAVDLYDAGGGTSGPCYVSRDLIELDNGQFRDDDGYVYNFQDGFYIYSGESVGAVFGENLNNTSYSYSWFDDDEEESAEPTDDTAEDPDLEGESVGDDDPETEGNEAGGLVDDTESGPGTEIEWKSTFSHDVGEPFSGEVRLGEMVLYALVDGEHYRDEDGFLYEILQDDNSTVFDHAPRGSDGSGGYYGYSIGMTVNEYFADKPEYEPPAKSLLVPRHFFQPIFALIVGLGVYAALLQVMKKNLAAQNMLADTEDINQYTGDQHIALPEEIQRRYDWFPDVGAHSSVSVSSMISHMALLNKGVNKIQMARRYDKDIIDEDGHVVCYKGEIMRDENGDPIMMTVPMFDEKFAEALFEASGAPEEVRFSYDPSTIPYNPGNGNREKLQGPYDGPSVTAIASSSTRRLFGASKNDAAVVGAPGGEDEPKKGLLALLGKKGDDDAPAKKGKYEYVTDVINKDWTFPEYEPQRPAGAYIVDTAPVNTMVLAITRAGKGQTVIEPTIDMWTREHRGNNMVINDPKGELLVKFYARGAYRGYQIVQFNLINAMKTDIYNPLGMAAQSAREGDFTKCAMYVENIAEVFFPVDGGDDPVWPNAANNAFKRAAYGLIDYYLEEERKYRNECNAKIARGEHVDPQTMETYIDNMWGRVTLYNCYQMFTQLTSKKLPNPATAFGKKMQGLKKREDGDYEDESGKIYPYDEIVAEAEYVNKMSPFWNDAPEADCLTLYFAATEKMPNNSMRTLVSNVNNALKAMAGAEKMMASVYGIAITAMSFFTDPTISTLTSGTPSQTVDLAGYSFPRRMGVRFHPDYITKNHYIGLQCRWDAFEDKAFTKPLGKLFQHSDIVSREGWARYYFDGKFEKDVAYVRLRLFNANSGVLVHEYFFEFHKDYQKSLDGRTYVKDPLLGTKMAKNGAIFELLPDRNGAYKAGTTTFSRRSLKPVQDKSKEVKFRAVDENTPAITQTYVRYAEKPKMTFLVTPPHLMKYAKLILILIKQLVDLNFDQSYMTKETQKPRSFYRGIPCEPYCSRVSA